MTEDATLADSMRWEGKVTRGDWLALRQEALDIGERSSAEANTVILRLIVEVDRLRAKHHEESGAKRFKVRRNPWFIAEKKPDGTYHIPWSLETDGMVREYRENELEIIGPA